MHHSSRGLTVMHSTKTNVVLGSRPTAGHWRRQEGHPVLNAHDRTKFPLEAPPSPKELGETEVKSSKTKVACVYAYMFTFIRPLSIHI